MLLLLLGMELPNLTVLEKNNGDSFWADKFAGAAIKIPKRDPATSGMETISKIGLCFTIILPEGG